MRGSLTATLIMGVTALVLLALTLRDRARTGQWTSAGRTRLVVAAIFAAVIAWLNRGLLLG